MHIKGKKKALTIKEEQIIQDTEVIGEEIHTVEDLRDKISENIRTLFEYYSDEDNLPAEMKNAA